MIGTAGSHEQNETRRPRHQLKRKITGRQKPRRYCDRGKKRTGFATHETEEAGLRSRTNQNQKVRNNRSIREQQKSEFSLRNNKRTIDPQRSPSSHPHLISGIGKWRGTPTL
jgi:hypothetical protein